MRCKRRLIPRLDYESIYLCVFTDASQRGYAVVAYIVCDYGNEVTVSFASGKVRVAPNKKLITIPRLELMAAVAGVDLATTIKAELNITFTETRFWTDSTTVLHWITNPDLQLKAFVANRVAKVIEGSQEAAWSYVNTKITPADIGSRGLRPSDNQGIQPWLNGPAWLQAGPNAWPKEVIPSPPAEKDLEIKKINTISFVRPLDSPLHRLLHRSNGIARKGITRYAPLTDLKTSVAWLLRFRSWLRRKKQKCELPPQLTLAELDQAVIELVRIAQWDQFPLLMHA